MLPGNGSGIEQPFNGNLLDYTTPNWRSTFHIKLIEKKNNIWHFSWLFYSMISYMIYQW